MREWLDDFDKIFKVQVEQESQLRISIIGQMIIRQGQSLTEKGDEVEWFLAAYVGLDGDGREGHEVASQSDDWLVGMGGGDDIARLGGEGVRLVECSVPRDAQIEAGAQPSKRAKTG